MSVARKFLHFFTFSCISWNEKFQDFTTNNEIEFMSINSKWLYEWKQFSTTWERTGARLAGAAAVVVMGLWGDTEGLRTVCGAGCTRAPAVMTVVVGFWAEVIVTTAVFCYKNKSQVFCAPQQKNVLPKLKAWNNIINTTWNTPKWILHHSKPTCCHFFKAEQTKQ